VGRNLGGKELASPVGMNDALNIQKKGKRVKMQPEAFPDASEQQS